MFADRTRKQKWTHAEDASLIAAVQKLGTKSWKDIADFVPGRNGKQCRERWTGQLSPTITKDVWTPEEDSMLIVAQNTNGNRWALIAKMLHGRSSISVKNRWGWLQRHGLLSDGQKAKQSNPPKETNNNANQTPQQPPNNSEQIFAPVKPRKYFTPLEVPDTIFGEAFQAFQKTLLI